MARILCIAGPTASGKSAYAMKRAVALNGEIINADSMQVYAPLHILSARPTLDDEKAVPHHLYGCVDGDVRYSTGQWLRDVMQIIQDVQNRGKTPILVGGTGLYFQALTVGLAHIPEPSDAAKKQTQTLLSDGIDVLRAEAERLDPIATTRVLGHDPQRLGRIVSVALGTDKPLSEWQKDTKPLLEPESWTGDVILPERDSLYAKINARYDDMIHNGGLEEAETVSKLGLSPDLPMMKAIGLPPLLAHIKGEISLEHAIEQAKRDTRRFAKRQFTWFKSRTIEWQRYVPVEK